VSFPWYFLPAALVGFAVAYTSVLLLRPLAHRYCWLDYPAAHKRHDRPTPIVGGWAVFVGFWAGVSVAWLLIPDFRAEWGLYLRAVFLAHLLIFLGGVADDFLSLSAVTKLLIQVAAAVILMIGGLKISTVYVPFSGSFLLGDLAYPVTILWVLIIVNAVNVIDGLDGLAGTLSSATAVGLLYTGLALAVPSIAGINLILICVLFAFLRFNFFDASVFLGDSGSQSIGFIFAVQAIFCPIKSYTVVAMFVPLLSLGLPLLELTTSFLRRVATGRSPVVADRSHLFHLLLQRGMRPRRIVVAFSAVALALQVFVFALFMFDRRVVFSILVLFMLVAASLFVRIARGEEK
jgi:UDP-GlcNAc:undecaprenyl-phosphate GlcNAc-1-phosphate transferase